MNTLLIDDHPVFRRGCRTLLADIDEEMSFLEAGSIDEAAALPAADIDLVILDLYLPGTCGIDGLLKVRELFGAPVVVLSMEQSAAVVHDVLESGAVGFVPKEETEEFLEVAVRGALLGQTFVPSGYTTRAASKADPVRRLTHRQQEVLSLAAQGKPNKVIARALDIEVGTVKAHLAKVYEALCVDNRTGAAALLHQLGYACFEDDRAPLRRVTPGM